MQPAVLSFADCESDAVWDFVPMHTAVCRWALGRESFMLDCESDAASSFEFCRDHERTCFWRERCVVLCIVLCCSASPSNLKRPCSLMFLLFMSFIVILVCCLFSGLLFVVGCCSEFIVLCSLMHMPLSGLTLCVVAVPFR